MSQSWNNYYYAWATHSIKAHILRGSLISLAVRMSIVSTVCMPAAAARTLSLLVLLRRPHPSMQVNSSCSNSPLQWWCPRSVESTTRPWQRIDLVSCFARGSVACWVSKRFAAVHSRMHLYGHVPLFVHMALQIRPIEMIVWKFFLFYIV